MKEITGDIHRSAGIENVEVGNIGCADVDENRLIISGRENLILVFQFSFGIALIAFLFLL